MFDPITLLVLLHNSIAIALWVFSAALVVFIATRKRWPWWVRGSCLGAIAAFFAFMVFLPWQRAKEIEAEQLAYGRAAYAYFREQCAKDSGRFVYKPVERPQESVYIMKPRKGASIEDLRDQFWMGDPYMGAYYYPNPFEIASTREMRHYIGSGDEYSDGKDTMPYFSFAEAPDLDDPGRLWRYIYEPTGRMKETEVVIRAGKVIPWQEREIMKYPEKKMTRVPINVIQSRYGFTWDDLSTPESRHYWVAKSRLQIIDLRNHEVIAERIGYVIEGKFGKGAGSGWDGAGGGELERYGKTNYCPPRISRNNDLKWIRSLLLGVPFE
jgi:hypothetical protein